MGALHVVSKVFEDSADTGKHEPLCELLASIVENEKRAVRAESYTQVVELRARHERELEAEVKRRMGAAKEDRNAALYAMFFGGAVVGFVITVIVTRILQAS